MKEDLSFKTIKDAVIYNSSEVHFGYKGKYYWIAHYNNGSHLSDEEESTQYFNNAEELFKNATINGKSLEEIWDDVEVDSVS
jgi:DNA-binding ferritin-like protein (Dps family)